MSVTIHPVRTSGDQHDFYKFAWRVYKNDPCWVPYLWPQRKDYLTHKAAFFTYGEGDFWLAKRGREIVGTIGTAINPVRNRDLGVKAGIFGFFEVLPDDYDTAVTLWDHAREWSLSQGMQELQGPYSFSPNDENGFLVQGFDTMPTISMGHSPFYYYQFAERYGFQKLWDSLAYRYDLKLIDFNVDNAPEIVHRIRDRALKHVGISAIQNPDMKKWDFEVERLWQTYNKSLAVLPDFTPLELAEFRSQANGLKDIIDPELVFLAIVKGEVVGFGLGLPNIYEALKFANGLRFPWDYLRLAWARRKITSASFKILAIVPEYWGYGLDVLMYLEMGKALIRKGYTWVDASLTGETNPQTNKIATRVGAYVYRRYREYRLAL